VKGKISKETVIRGIASNTAIQMIGKVLLITIGILLARNLGSEKYGEYTYLISIITVIGLPIASGLSVLVTREISHYNSRKNGPRIKGLLRVSNAYIVTTSLVISIASLGILQYGGIETDLDKNDFYWCLLLLPLLQWNAYIGSILKGLRYVTVSELPSQIIKPLITVALIGLLSKIEHPLNVNTSIKITISATLIAIIIGQYCFNKRKPGYLSNSTPEYEIDEWTRSLIPLSLLSLLYILNSQICIIILGYTAENHDVAIFQVAFQASAIAAIGLNVINSVTTPNIVHLYAQGRKKALQTLLTKSAQLATLFTTTILLLYFYYGEELINLIFGSEYKEAKIAMLIMTTGHLISAATGSVGVTLQMLKHEKINTTGYVMALATNTCLLAILAPKLGTTGAAISYAASIIFLNLYLSKKLLDTENLNSSIIHTKNNQRRH